ncbi:MAG TPA: PQQ-dependent sugar dehydrogenase [Ignavibacteriaceae bacterium]|nr:PQQ-dependent sugar dehydrogenase [Ignavibacteriaceae bacterium]
MKKVFLIYIFLILFIPINRSFTKDLKGVKNLGIKLPPHFKIEVYAKGIKGARSMTLSPAGVLYIGTRIGSVYAVLASKKDNKADEIITIAKDLNMPNGVAFRNGTLYVAEINRVIKFPNIESDLHHPPKPVVVNDNFPSDLHHGWKFIRFGPDGKLYIPIGAPCNICAVKSPYASIWRMNPDGSNLEEFASGIRNTVGFDWDPLTKVLWFTDNGRDMLGDNLPPDELNEAPHKGMNFGFPYVYGNNIPNPEFAKLDKNLNLSKFTEPAQDLGPHVASLGMRFYTGKMFPKKYWNQIFIAEHGSWNRTHKIGYRITLVRLDANRKPISYEPFAEGWLKKDESITGRPVDIQIMPDGSMLISDDYAGIIYRISYSKKG